MLEVVLNLYIGDIFSFHFHMTMMKELFGENEVKEILKFDKQHELVSYRYQ